MLVNTKDIQTSGSLGGRKIRMTVDMNSLSHIMSVLSGMYSDPAGAVIREYTTNALDSHIAAGQTRPVELESPNRLSPFFIVRDFGVGMSEDDIENIYSQFGNSTKRQTNDQAGQIGIGSKSALAFTEQFNIISIKDGKRVVAAIGRTIDGAADIEIVSVKDTDEHNGVTIKIPVNTGVEVFAEKIKWIIEFVTPGAVTLDGEVVENELEFFSPKLATRRQRGLRGSQNIAGRDRVVMGNVAYPTNNNLLSGHQVVYFVDMGELDFTPAREELMFTERTNATLDKMREEFHRDFQASLATRVDDAETYRDAWELSRKLEKEFGAKYWQHCDATHRGISVYTPTERFARWNSDNIIYDYSSFYTGIDDDTVVITDWHNSRLSRSQVTKIEKFFAEKDMVVTRCYMGYDQVSPQLLTKNKRYSWNDIIKTGIAPRPKVVRTVAKWEGLGGVQASSGWSRPQMFVPDKSLEIYFGAKSSYGQDYIHKMVTSDKVQFFFVTPSQVERFTKLYPTAKGIQSFFEKGVIEYLSNLTKLDYEFFANSRNESELPFPVDYTKLDDPRLAIIAGAQSGKYEDEEAAYNRALSLHARLSYTRQKKLVFPTFKVETENCLSEYPLLGMIRTYSLRSDDELKNQEHLAIYANAVYANKMKNKESK